MIDVERETSETFRRIDAILPERMRCPFQNGMHHDLKFLGAKFGRFVTEWVRCRRCLILYEIERGVFHRAVVNWKGQIVPRPDPIADRNERQRVARRTLRNERRH